MAEPRGLTELRNPAVIAAFGGWNDAGEAASGVIDHLVERYGGQLLFALDPEEYYDFQVNRPIIKAGEDGRRLEWPTTEVLIAALDERDLVLIGGPEPNYRWQAYSSRLVSMLRSIQPEMVVLLGAMLTDSPHSRPVPVTGTASEGTIGSELGLEPSDYAGPTGIVGVLANDCEQAGLPVVSLWASVPHYVADPPNPKATLALLARLEDVLNVALDTGDLSDAATMWMTQVDELVADDPEVAGYVSALEERRDETTPDPSGDSIAAEFERYLRRRDRRRG